MIYFILCLLLHYQLHGCRLTDRSLSCLFAFYDTGPSTCMKKLIWTTIIDVIIISLEKRKRKRRKEKKRKRKRKKKIYDTGPSTCTMNLYKKFDMNDNHRCNTYFARKKKKKRKKRNTTTFGTSSNLACNRRKLLVWNWWNIKLTWIYCLKERKEKKEKGGKGREWKGREGNGREGKGREGKGHQSRIQTTSILSYWDDRWIKPDIGDSVMIWCQLFTVRILPFGLERKERKYPLQY